MTQTIPDFIDAFAQLVALPSVSSTDPAFDMSNRPVVDRLAGWLDALGFRIQIMPVPGSDCEKVNLIATLGSGEDGLVLAGHTDTVPYNESIWSSNPFKLTERDHNLYGLGSSDMKCLFPIAMQAVQAFAGKTPQHPLTILATADEESSMAGARVLRDAGVPLGRHALIGEPTGLKPVIKHKGIFVERIELIGQSGHSSDPSLGNNALEGMNRVMNSLLAWREQLQQQFSDANFKVPVPTMNLGAIKGGDNPNRICASCELAIDLRLLPGMSAAEFKTQLHQIVTKAVEPTGLKVIFHHPFGGIEAMQTDAASEMVRMCEQFSGQQASAVAFGTEGPFLNALGMDTVILGPGDIDVAHQADEYLPLERIKPMQTILENLIQHFCQPA